MSKIGRKAIPLGSATVEVKGQEVHYKGSKGSGVYALPEAFSAEVKDGKLEISVERKSRTSNSDWGMHRALLANRIRGVDEGFTRLVEITGLGYKAAPKGTTVEFSLGYSHKIMFELPKEVTLEVDRSGQKLTFKSHDKELLGSVCSRVRDLRPPEPYKGTGIKYADETIIRKAGKAKA